jgi:hypothetical protein
MANLTLAPEDDDFKLSPAQKDGSNATTRLKRFRLDVNAENMEFGSVSPWPDIEQTPGISGSGVALPAGNRKGKERQ